MRLLTLKLLLILSWVIIFTTCLHLAACGGNDDMEESVQPPDNAASQIPGHECHILGNEYVCS